MTLVTRDEIRSRSATPPVSGLTPLLMDVGGSDIRTPQIVGMTLSARMVIIWHRGKTKVNRLLGNPLSETRAAHESTCRLPYEFVEMIIAHLAHDLDALKACSLACRSWHTVAVPHLYHTLTLRREKPSLTHDGTSPPSARDKLKPLSKLHDLGLISVVEEIRVEQRVEGWSGINTWFVPHEFNRRDLRYFSTFTNVRTLRLQNLEIYRFVPNIERYFGHFSPTLRSIVLFEPRCTPRQLSYILSLFSNLENIEIEGTAVPDKIIPETVLVPFSAPKLRGRLALYDFDWVETWTHLITSCGGLRFRHLDLRGSASCVSVLLEACSGTLETLRINATDGSIGKRFCMSFRIGFGLMVNRN